MKMFWLKMKNFRRIKSIKRHAKNFPKLINVALSCTTKSQCISAMRYLALYRSRYNDDNAFNLMSTEIENRILMYLQDTSTHDQYNYHKPHYNGYKTITTWPDLNSYLNDLLDIKFKKSWSRGTGFVAI